MACFILVVHEVHSIIIGTYPEVIIFILVNSGNTARTNQILVEKFTSKIVKAVRIVSEQKNSFLKKTYPQVSGSVLKYGMNLHLRKIKNRSTHSVIFNSIVSVIIFFKPESVSTYKELFLPVDMQTFYRQRILSIRTVS